MITNRAMIEGFIFACPHPVSEKTIIDTLGFDAEEVKNILAEITTEYESENRGFSLVKVSNGYQFRTKPDLREPMARFYEKKPPRLTQATLEVLSVVAYKQPIIRPEIERIRGVDCTAVLQTLLERELIEMQGRSNLPGHPVIYGTTPKFLEWFQINDVADLPPLAEVEALNRSAEAGADNLLGLLNRDEGFVAESINEMDETLRSVARFEIQDPFAKKEEEAAAAEGSDSTEGSTQSSGLGHEGEMGTVSEVSMNADGGLVQEGETPKKAPRKKRKVAA